MGNTCNCYSFDKKDDGEMLYGGLDEEQAIVHFRTGLPLDVIAINVKQINVKIKDIKERNEINKMLFKVVNHEREFRTPMNVGKKPIPQNALNDPYYIPGLNAFYIGEWVYEKKLQSNAPGGIGRLY